MIGFFGGIAFSAICWFSPLRWNLFLLSGGSSLIVTLIALKVGVAAILLCMRDTRAIGGGVLLSILGVALIFLGVCAIILSSR